MQTLIRRLEPGETGAVRRMWEESFPEGGPRFTNWYFSRVYQRERTLGMFDGEELLSNLQMIPYPISLRDKPVLADTLSGVATGTKHRNKGYARALMAEALRDMAHRGVGFTFLYPFSHGFYERLGWATCSEALETLRPAAELPDAPPVGGRVETVRQPAVSVLSGIYDTYMGGRNCRCLREERHWTRRVEETEANGGFILIAYFGDRPAAYAMCEERPDPIELTELAYTRPEAVTAILAALKPRGRAVLWTAPADDRARLLPGPWKDRVRLQPHVMFRVTSVKLAFEHAAPAFEGSFVIEVTGDNMAPENNGVYRVTARDGVARAERTDDAPEFSCDIGTLARVLTGFADAGEAVGAGLVSGRPEISEMVNRMYPKRMNFLFELY